MELTPLRMSAKEIKEVGRPITSYSSWESFCFSWVYPVVIKGSGLCYNEELQVPSDVKIDQFIDSGRYDGSKGLFKLILRNNLQIFVKSFLLECCCIVFEFSSPIFIQILMGYLEDKGSSLKTGLWIFSAFFLVSFLYPFVDTHRRFISSRMSIRVRNSLYNLISKKVLNSNNLPEGTCISLLSVDTENVVTFIWALPYYLLIPVQITLCTVIIHSQLGNSIWFAILIIFSALGLNTLFMSTCQKANERLMKIRDLRLSQTTQFLTEIKSIKANGWERQFVKKIEDIRNEELKKQRTVNILNSVNSFFFYTLPSITAVVIISYYTEVMGEQLSPEKVFVTLSTLFLLQVPIMEIPDSIMKFVEAWVSKGRIQGVLMVEEIKVLPLGKNVSFKNAFLSYNDKQVLKDINLTIFNKEFVGIVGQVGSGKSSLLLSVMGELILTSGEITTSSSIAYTGGLDSWLINASIRENILMGCEYNEKKYLEILDACCLQSDIKQFPANDLTEIGERGINLSGGQKARVCLARAIYSDKQLYLLDDPLSSVDDTVAKTIYEKCILGLLKDKTRVLATHRTEYLYDIDRVVYLKNGEISKILSADEWENEMDVEEEIDESEEELENHQGVDDEDFQDGELVQEEDKEIGEVTKDVYACYFRYSGGYVWISLAVICISGWIVIDTVADIILKDWSDDSSNASTYFASYIALKLGGTILVFISSIILHCIMSIKASKSSHSCLITSLSQAPINLFYDITPIGRIINRLSHDLDIIDTSLPNQINYVLVLLSVLASIIIVSLIYFPILIFLIPAILYPARKIISIYIHASRELTRFDSISKSPILSCFKEILQGAKSIRAFEISEIFIKKFYTLVNKNTGFEYYFAACREWTRLYLGILCSTFSCSIFLLAVIFRDSISVSSVGLCLSYAFFLPEVMSEFLMTLTELENDMVAVERIRSMCGIVQEKKEIIGKELKNWPNQGKIEFFKVFMRYRRNTDLVLKGMDFVVGPGMHVGIVGRTGSGKSSMFLALLRVVELESGVIFIDGVNIATVNLEQLRKSFTLIPQDPLVFNGTIQENLDPFNVHEKSVLEEATNKVGVKFALDFEVKNSGKNLSVGERQMLSLCRALISNSKIVLFDEATAGIDLETDTKIQGVLSSILKDSTVLTIAHRSSTIEKFDVIFEMDNGSIINKIVR